MNTLERAGYLAHARTIGYHTHLRRARETIRETLALCARPFVAFSAGKDSSVLLWLVAEAQPTITARILTGGETRILYPNLDACLAWWRKHWPRLDLCEICIDHVFAPAWETVGFWEQYESFTDEWERYLRPTDADGIFLGLRAAESPTRRRSLRQRCLGTSYALYRYQTGTRVGVLRAAPLDAWTDQDVAAFITQYNLPLLDVYTAHGLQQRSHNRLGRTSMRCGQLHELRLRDPAGYARLIARFPELLDMERHVT